MKDDPQLRTLLQNGMPSANPSQRFAAEVWKRIENRAQQQPRSLWRQLAESFLALFARPAVAAFAVLLAVGGAAGAASLHASQSNEKAKQELAERHLANLDPYARMVAMR